MFRTFIDKVAAIFAQKNADLRFERVTEDRYDNYGISQVLHRKAVEESAEWMRPVVNDCMLFSDKKRLYAYAAKHLKQFESDEQMLFLEFGVQTGTSINFLSSRLSHTFFGFDTFEGMPEEWTGWNVEKGQFSMEGKMPIVNKNVQLIKGLIQNTLPQFLQQHGNKKIGFLHIDTDTYTPAKIILQLCKSRLVKGSLILFDELHSYISWKQHELKALQEELETGAYKFRAFSDRKQALIEML